MTHGFKTAIAGLGLALTVSNTASAQEPVCMTALNMEATLHEWYGEQPVPGEVDQDYSTVQIWASPETGTWTLVKYLIDGSACVLDEGENFDRSRSAPDLIAALID